MSLNLVYAGLLLHSAGKELNEESVKKIAEATGESVDDAQVKAFITAIKDVNIEETRNACGCRSCACCKW